MNKTFWLVGSLALGCVLTSSGCNVGMAPQPMDEAQLKTAVDNLPPKEAIDYINASPMPPEMKAQRIAEIVKKTGYNVPATNTP